MYLFKQASIQTLYKIALALVPELAELMSSGKTSALEWQRLWVRIPVVLVT